MTPPVRKVPIPASQADVALVGIPVICAMSAMSRSQWDELVRTKVAPQPVIRRPRFVRWRLTDVRQFLVAFAAGGNAEEDAAKVADVQAKRLATREANSSPGAKRTAKAKAGLKQRGGAVSSIALQPETVTAAAYLVSTGWAPSRDAAINRAVQALAEAQRLCNGAANV